MEVSPLPAPHYKRPRKRLASYVAMYNESTGKATGKKMYIEMPIRKGHQDLQALAEHINSKIESLLSSSSVPDSGQSKTPNKAETPKVGAHFFNSNPWAM